MSEDYGGGGSGGGYCGGRFSSHLMGADQDETRLLQRRALLCLVINC